MERYILKEPYEVMQFSKDYPLIDILSWGRGLIVARGSKDGCVHLDIGSLKVSPKDWIVKKSEYVFHVYTDDSFKHIFKKEEKRG